MCLNEVDTSGCFIDRYLCLLVKLFIYRCLVYDGIRIMGLEHLLQILVSVKLVFELCTMFVIVIVWPCLLQGVCFSMPLCNTEVEQSTEDDLIELSEIQRRNLGQVYFPSDLCLGKKNSFQFRLVCCNQYAEELTIRKPTSFYLQALHLDALSDVDNTAQSLLMFTGNESVHGLYDILLNCK